MRWKCEMPNIDVVPELTQETYDIFWKIVMQNPKYRPYRIGFSEPYDKVAFYLEHGTGPATPGKKEPPRSDGYTARDRIGAWVEKQYPDLSDSKMDAKKNEMYKQIMETGTPPHPFIRPAIEDIIESGRAKKIIEEGGTMRDITDEIIKRMGQLLREGDHIKYSVNNDSIEKHIYAVPYSDREFGQPSELSVYDVLKTWKEMDERSLAAHMSRLSEYRNKTRGNR